MTKKNRNYVITAALFILFALFTLLVTKVDVKELVVNNLSSSEGEAVYTSVGFAAINEAVRDTFAFNKLFYTITKLTGVIAILVAALFALLGVAQLVKGKSFANVDKDIYALAITYVLVIIAYILFEKLELNYRPVDLGEGLEASYPSTHSMLALSIFGTAMIQFHKRLHGNQLRMIVQIVSAILIVITVVGRLIAGVHWFTDIIGGVILGCAFIMLYYSMQYAIEDKKKNGR